MDNTTLNFWKIFGRRNQLLALSLCFCLAIIYYRVEHTASLTYLFLVWNLFLAFIPYAISQLLLFTKMIHKSLLVFLVFFSIWLLFIPNAPYIITDLMHLRYKNGNMLWFDAFLIFVFAWNGTLLCLLSFQDMYRMIASKWNTKFALFSIIIIAFLCGFGIYLGRFLRWNSWELFSQPQQLFNDILLSCLNPKYRFKTWGVTIGFGSFLSILFLFFKRTNKSYV